MFFNIIINVHSMICPTYIRAGMPKAPTTPPHNAQLNNGRADVPKAPTIFFKIVKKKKGIRIRILRNKILNSCFKKIYKYIFEYINIYIYFFGAQVSFAQKSRRASVPARKCLSRKCPRASVFRASVIIRFQGI